MSRRPTCERWCRSHRPAACRGSGRTQALARSGRPCHASRRGNVVLAGASMRRTSRTAWFAFGLAVACDAGASPVVLPAETEVRLALSAPISTRKVKIRDEFELTTVAPIVVDG